MSLRIFFVGGWMSYRALFGWLTPWILIPTFLIEPILQIIFFAYVGRSVGVENDEFFLIGNAVVAAAIPCLFATGNTIEGERQFQTLGLLLASPAKRVPLFLGRALPVIVNGFLVAMFALVVGALVLRVAIPVSTLPLLAVVIAVSAFSCTGLGLVTASIALRVRESAVLSNLVLGVLLVFCGVNVALVDLPAWMAATAEWLPLTHGIEAARELAAGAPWSEVSGSVILEAAVGLLYVGIGLVMLKFFELESRRTASLDRL
ncbi:MAG TPA: ABC transporter permease [Actinomycetes bacterium]|nr:ABC transporter permease [Actinomycetes bacterium]